VAIAFNESEVAREPVGQAAERQRLMTAERFAGTNILLDRLTLAPSGRVTLETRPADIAWFQMLDGAASLTRLDGPGETLDLSDGHVAFMPPGCRVTLVSDAGASLIFATIPDAGRFDDLLSNSPLAFRAVDWKREPVLDSQHDARKRIYLVTPKLAGTKVLKGEMIIYPPGTKAANHHHEGAEHFMYILRGRGTAWANETPFAVRAGDVVYYHDLERHYLKADDDSELVFSEFFVPGEYKTIWVDEGEVCTWLPTGRDIGGGRPVREIAAHSSAGVASPADV
jgi:quercetin dioxygenase-like cupin family protein